MLTDPQRKDLLESEIKLIERAVEFLRSVPGTMCDYERRSKELRLASLKFQLKLINDRLDSQISI